MTSFDWLRRAVAGFAVTVVVGVAYPVAPARAVPGNGPAVCDHLIGTRDAYYEMYLSAPYDDRLLGMVGRYTWDATDAGCFGTDPALRQRAFAPRVG